LYLTYEKISPDTEGDIVPGLVRGQLRDKPTAVELPEFHTVVG